MGTQDGGSDNYNLHHMLLDKIAYKLRFIN